MNVSSLDLFAGGDHPTF